MPEHAVLNAGNARNTHLDSTGNLSIADEWTFRRTAVMIAITVETPLAQRLNHPLHGDSQMQPSDLDLWIRRDPAGRGLFSQHHHESPPCAEHLASASNELVTQAKSVAIVTGFYVPDATTPAAETDGPLGATLLADVLNLSGVETLIITDELCESTVRTAMASCGVEIELLVCPIDRSLSHAWREELWSCEPGRSLTHLISVERVGPSLHEAHHEASCRNMRGQPIDDWSADLYRLFEECPAHIRTIGIGDGGNEIGMGTFWDEIGYRLSPPLHACRTPTNWTVLAGVSDWGAMALATAFTVLRSDLGPLNLWTTDRLLYALEQMVEAGPTIDGCTQLAEPTIDGLPFATYIQPWELIRQLLGLDL